MRIDRARLAESMDAAARCLTDPTGMIFVPSRGGRSHCEEEFTGLDDIEHGANALLLTCTELAEAENVGM